ncbi:hypothetical protein IM792_06140 [Mucilaginibacter sp. JRF]|uniref:hypothetical protein n=1 Tax=Mucilaginibacter sp. JRF TaxID=2780088 RepID=UPI00187E9C0C|nr:hypothetical protein [Mucilaginibacter sp. JRF]MBE9584023.1 hypothetical protein [Mucilaginibacter sp. JRF]
MSNSGTPASISEIEKDIVEALKVYHSMAIKLHSIYVVLGLIAISSSVFVTTFVSGSLQSGVYKDALPYVSFAATASLTLITAFNLGNKANNCRKGWRYLHYAFARYKADIIKLPELLKARDEAETILGGVDFQYNPKPTPN